VGENGSNQDKNPENLTPAELKKLRNKQRKAEKKAQQDKAKAEEVKVKEKPTKAEEEPPAKEDELDPAKLERVSEALQYIKGRVRFTSDIR